MCSDIETLINFLYFHFYMIYINFFGMINLETKFT